MKKEIIEWIKTIAMALAIAFTITFFITPLEVHSVSMNPTLVERDYLILRNTHSVERGDIVSFKTDIQYTEAELQQFNFIQRLRQGKTKNLIKRVIALPGDTLMIREGKVYVNGEQLEEAYLNGEYTSGDIEIDRIPEGQIFVMGDNRDNSLDSRSFGPVDMEMVQGKAIFRVLPVEKIGKLD
ncbi:signal peptidase I [Geosporobacter ferrireducens]|uniref:Signal peptidase I n=1 Tax=Geosporobacter ferrireducens TaxID=1424294 RepID=A0A1D8GFU5_9FIRM|nr:signal peptidase I [Geosporobacter ferrireducens]AOT69776.1 signal peptidase I [Geosporobacter ferrireducens]MTI54511.1 signal peptidase I [Geosporobacter ferrireducens]